jgi:hypothetical protein
LVSAPEEKDTRRDKVWRIAHGMVVLNLPDELAWTICVDWRDFEVIGMSFWLANAEMYGMLFIQDLIRTIPQSGLAKTFSAYLSSALSAFPPEKPDETDETDGKEKKQEPVNVSQEEILDAMIVSPSSAG